MRRPTRKKALAKRKKAAAKAKKAAGQRRKPGPPKGHRNTPIKHSHQCADCVKGNPDVAPLNGVVKINDHYKETGHNFVYCKGKCKNGFNKLQSWLWHKSHSCRPSTHVRAAAKRNALEVAWMIVTLWPMWLAAD